MAKTLILYSCTCTIHDCTGPFWHKCPLGLSNVQPSATFIHRSLLIFAEMKKSNFQETFLVRILLRVESMLLMPVQLLSKYEKVLTEVI